MGQIVAHFPLTKLSFTTEEQKVDVGHSGEPWEREERSLAPLGSCPHEESLKQGIQQPKTPTATKDCPPAPPASSLWHGIPRGPSQK